MSGPRLSGLNRRAAVVLALASGLAALSGVAAAQAERHPAGGATTVLDEGPTAFGRALANLDPLRWDEFRAGKERFVREWPQRGPWGDASSCDTCHARDGRGPDPPHDSRSHLLRLDGPSSDGDPVYGVQLRREGYGVPPPGRFTVRWLERRGRYASGESYVLREPAVDVRDLAYGPLDAQTRMSLRVPPAVFGLGLLEAVPESEILALADADDADCDGVSGRPQRVRDPSTGQLVLGRFGWKAARPSLAAQSAAALAIDLGVTNPIVASGTPHDGSGSHGGRPEIDESELTALVRYLRALAVPARRRPTDPQVQQGEAIFDEIGCARCHRPRLTTGVVPGWPELSNQTIGAYTDLLLHDMGARLGDGVSEGVASGREWRTPPLWGLGLLPTVNGPVGLLHDGRAASPEEAILWHGGEAEAARERFVSLPGAERDALIAFLSTL